MIQISENGNYFKAVLANGSKCQGPKKDFTFLEKQTDGFYDLLQGSVVIAKDVQFTDFKDSTGVVFGSLPLFKTFVNSNTGGFNGGGAAPDLTGYATETWVIANTPQGQFLGSITPTSTPTGSGANYWNATQAGTYTNFGGVVVAANSFAFISRSATGVFSISQTALNLTEYSKLSDTVVIVEGVNASANGYYSSTTGALTSNNSWRSIKFPVNSTDKLYATAIVTGSLTALAVYYNSSGVFISSEKIGLNPLPATTYTKELLTIPANTSYVGISSYSTTTYGLLHTLASTALDKRMTSNDRLILDTESVVGIGETVNGFYAYDTGAFGVLSTYNSIKFPVNPLDTYYASASSFNTGTALAVYYNSSGTYISFEKRANNTATIVYDKQKLTIPTNAAFVGLTSYLTNQLGKLDLLSVVKYKDLKAISDAVNALTPATPINSVWFGKKIAWYGTSIPAGFPNQSEQNVYSYANRSAIQLGATIQNYSVPNGIIRKFKSTGLATGRAPSLSFTNTAGTANYLTQMVNLIGTSNEPDLFVFDYSVNDYDEDSTDIQAGNWDLTSESLNTFHGSFGFVIKQLLLAKPKARIAIFCHFSDDTAALSNGWGKTNELIEKIGIYWGIPVLKVHQKSGLIKKNGINTISNYMPDNIHPATDTTGKTVEILTNLAYDFLKSIS
jgi:hypothetical protein